WVDSRFDGSAHGADCGQGYPRLGFQTVAAAIAAGAFAVLALPPIGFFAAMFDSFTLLVWLIDIGRAHLRTQVTT
ncbi:hypothetical protein, partial [Rhizobium brockwellii]|uniref:hypothetical protein n=1 Tax=Rhizobium brockwellii TaxID=3019932 RepID=UPI003F989B3F